MDLHLHTPGSNDYQEDNVSYLDILRQAELRGLDIIAFTDHNTIAGYAAMQREIENLRLLGSLDRLEVAERRRLDEYERLQEKILVLPGFEFTATLGFHILGIFPPETPITFLEHLLLTLRVPLDKLQEGSSLVGSTMDVLTAYRVINDASGLAIAAHANSSNGVAMRGLSFGGQTRIAFTQDPNLHALEVTDLDRRGRYATRRFFDGSNPDYPRAMRCIQGSDAHRLVRDPDNIKLLGVGDRITEILLGDVTFEELSRVIKGNDLALTRPFRGKAPPYDFVQSAQEQGESLVQVFHDRMTQRGGYLNRIMEDICGMANTNGGTIYVGVSANPKETPQGVPQPNKAIERLQEEVSNRIGPEPHLDMDVVKTRGKSVVRITITPGADLPYAIDQTRFYVRDDTETNRAVRDEIVQLIQRSRGHAPAASESAPVKKAPVAAAPEADEADVDETKLAAPRTGVEIVESEKRKGTIYHTVRDLRNGNLIKNVTRASARKLWEYAITQVEEGKPRAKDLNWNGNVAIVSTRKKGDRVWYDLAQQDNGQIHVYFGVTDSGLNDEWQTLIDAIEKDR